MSQIRSYAETNVGLQRSNNEDTFLDCPEHKLWIVADGMGGHAAGEVASSIASQVIRDSYRKGCSLSESIQAGHTAVLKAAANGLGGRGMGSTVVVLATEANDRFQIGWVGDSRAYLWSENKLTCLSKDHSYVQMLFDSGLISEEDMMYHPEKNIITQCLGSLELESVNVSVVDGAWKGDDKILLCSDGLTDSVTDPEIEQILNEASSIESATTSLINAALSRGGKDNITVVLVESKGSGLRSLFKSIAGLFSFKRYKRLK